MEKRLRVTEWQGCEFCLVSLNGRFSRFVRNEKKNGFALSVSQTGGTMYIKLIIK